MAPNEHQKAYQKAAEAMARIVERDPSRAIWHFWLAAAHLEAGNAEESARQAKLAKELNDKVRQPQRKRSRQLRSGVFGRRHPLRGLRLADRTAAGCGARRTNPEPERIDRAPACTLE